MRFKESIDIDHAKKKKKQILAAREIIEYSLPNFIDKNSKNGTLVPKELVRLDLQGQFNENGIRYANPQIQLNEPRVGTQGGEEVEEDIAEGAPGKPRSTTIAIVLMPCGEQIPEIIMKRAFNVSLDDRMKAKNFKIL